MRRHFRLSTIWIAVCSSAMTLGRAQQPEPSFRVSSDLVVIDLVAVDRDGRFIDDLRADEIEVRDGGARQAIQLLRRVGIRGQTGTPALPSSDTPGAPAASAIQPAAPPDARRLAIVFDTLSLSVDAIPRVRDTLLTALADLPAGMPALVATIGQDVRILQPFTVDKDALRRAITALPAQLDPPVGVSRIFDAVDRVCAAAVDQARVGAAAIDAAEVMLADAQTRSAAASASLALLADRLAAREGRKHVVFYSSGHAISPVTQAVDAVAAAVSACTGADAMVTRRDATSAIGRQANRAAADGLRTAIDRANRAQLTFYTVDPAGITTSTILPSTRGTAQTGGRGPLIAFPGLRPDAGRDYVAGLAVETGGLTVRSNDLALVLRRAWEDAAQYYLIGYPSPPGRREGEIRTIAVSVKRRGASVRFRRGYVSRPPAAAPEPETVPTPRDTTARPPSASPRRDPASETACRYASVLHALPGPARRTTGGRRSRATHARRRLRGRVRRALLERGAAGIAHADLHGGPHRGRWPLARPDARPDDHPSPALRVPARAAAFHRVLARVPRRRRRRRQGSRRLAGPPRTALPAGDAVRPRRKRDAIAADGARFFLGTRTRTTTSPVFALAFLQPHHQSRFRYRLQRARGRDQAPRLVLTADETAEPTLLRTDGGGNLPLHGRYEIDAATGTVQISEVTLRRQERASCCAPVSLSIRVPRLSCRWR